MLKLIWRQILKNRSLLIPLVILWSLSGYFLYSYKHVWFGALSRWWLDLPAAGEQKPIMAYKYYLSAHERLLESRTDLRLMRMACEDFLPLMFREEIQEYRPHWLEKLERWQNPMLPKGASLDAKASDPDSYWSKHRPALLLSLKDIFDALNYAYEIPADIQDPDPQNTQKETILLPEIFARYSRGLCQPQLGAFIWGDYAHFQELRAWKAYQRKAGISGPVNERLKTKAILDELSGEENYIRALHEYVAGNPPYYGELHLCATGAFRLSCNSPEEAIEIYKKLLIVSPETQHDLYHLDLARTAWLRAHLTQNSQYLDEAREHFQQARQSSRTEREALFALAYLELEQKNSKDALEYLRSLSLQANSPQFPKQRFRELARKVLIANQLYRLADCYSEMSSNQYGRRTHCLTHRL